MQIEVDHIWINVYGTGTYIPEESNLWAGVIAVKDISFSREGRKTGWSITPSPFTIPCATKEGNLLPPGAKVTRIDISFDTTEDYKARCEAMV